ncbi:MAG: methyltransferase domain-containing protein [bacterium]|nr:methyltransferase domain-containing protein [bacterium]
MSFLLRVGLFLFGSGFCALVYQIAWLRLLRLIFGGSTPASATVIAIFMAGLGLGGLVLGRRSERSSNPLGYYANLEIGISVAAALSPLLISLVRTMYIGLGGTAVLGSFFGTLARLVFAAVVLGVPTFLMGGTLPAMVRAATRKQDLGRHTVGLLYAVNTVGAVAGALVTTFFLVELLGIRQTIWLAAALNLLIALMARSLSRERGAREPIAGAEAGETTRASEEISSTLYRLVLIAAAGVGFVFFLLELVWYRMMAPILGGSTYTFGVVLGVALAGIGIGGFLYGLAAQGRRPSPLEFAATCGLEALAMAIPLAAGDRIAFVALRLRDLSTAGFGALASGWAAVTCLVVLPAAIVAGYQFPLLIALLGSGRERVASQVGRTYAWNTFGAIVGSIAGGFWLIPALSAPTVWRLSIWALCVLAAVFLLHELKSAPRRVVLLAVLAATAVALTFAEGPTGFWRHAGIGAGRMKTIMKSPNALLDIRRGINRTLAWEVDGRESSVALSNGAGYAFMVNGKADGSARGDAPTQVMSGLIGTALHPNPRTGLVIGLGTGSSAGWMAQVPTMERVVAVELEPAILRVAEACAPVNENVLDNPKVEVVIADAREYLLSAKDTYDVIFSEPSNPYRAGISSLFTREFYRAVTERLSEDGIFAQWLQAYEIDAQVVRTAYATLASVFPYVETWQVHRSDLVLIGSHRPIDHSASYIQAAITGEPYDRALERVWGVTGLEGFYAGHVANNDFTRAVAELGLADLNTDDHPTIEFGFARSVGRTSGFKVAMLRRLATARGQHRPLRPPPIDWDRVDESHQSSMVMFKGVPETDGSEDDGQLARAEARNRYASGDLQPTFAAWGRQTQAPLQPLDRLAIAESAAEVGDETLPDLLEPLRASHPIEAGMIEARWLLRRSELEKAADRLAAALVAYRGDPWPLQNLTDRGLRLAHELVMASPESAPGILEALSRPFTLHLHDQTRLALLADLAYRFGQSGQCAVALLEFEPHTPWNERFLKMRRSCYERAGHPLAARAALDLEEFYLAGEIPFWHKLLPEDPVEEAPLEPTGVPEQSLSPGT